MKKKRIDISLKPLPLVEGKCPPISRYALRDGCFQKEWYYPEPDMDWEDPEIYEAENYRQEDKEEFYDYVNVCKTCGTKFIAYNNANKKAMNYCPFCGKKFEDRRNGNDEPTDPEQDVRGDPAERGIPARQGHADAENRMERKHL